MSGMPPHAPEAQLRGMAEARLAGTPPAKGQIPSAEKAVHELQVHQIELEMQNESLRESQVALEESRDLYAVRYADLYEFAPVAYVTLNSSGQIIEANLTASTLLGIERKHLLQSRFDLYVAAADWDRWQHHFLHAKSREGKQVLDMALQRRDGTLVHVHLDCLRLASNSLLPGLRLALTDISELRQASLALEASEQKYRLLAETADDWIFWIGQDGGYKYASPASRQISGHPPEDFLADPGLMPRLVHPDDRDGYQTHVRQEVADSTELEFRIVLPDGETRWIGHYCHPVFDEEGRLVGRRGSNRDITERKLMALELGRSEARFRQLFEASRDAMMIVAPPSWHFTEANRATLAMFGAGSLAEFTALGPWQVSPELQPDGRASKEKAPEMIQQAMREGVNAFEWQHRRLDGSCFDADVLLTRFEYAGQTMIQATARDISERKAQDAELKRRNEELERFNRAMIGRELDMLALKQRINALSRELGREQPFPLAFLNADMERGNK